MNQPTDPNQPLWGQPPAGGQPFQPDQTGAKPWADAPGPDGNRKLIGLLVGAVGLLAAIGVGLWLVLGGGDGRSVEETVDGYVAAAKANDKDEAKKFTCPKIDEEIDAATDTFTGQDLTIKVNSVDESGDTATAKVTATVGGESIDATLELIKNSDDDWEVCDIQLG